jgi:hypothetical protein
MPPDTKSLPENAGKTGLTQGTMLGLNDFKKTEYAVRRQLVGIVTSINSMRWMKRSI